MFTVYRPELAAVASTIRDRQRSFAAGDWSPDRLAAYQWERLRDTVRYVRDHSPFYRRTLGHLTDSAIAGLGPASWPRIPFTSKDELRDAQHDILSRPLSQAWILYETTGTTGPSTPCPRDNVDSLHNNSVLTTYYDTIFRQFGDDQIIGVSGPTEMHAFGDTFGEVCRNLGLAVAKMWPHAPTVGFPRALELMRTVPITGLFCTPGMALTLAKKIITAGLDPVHDYRLKVLMLTGELASPSLLANIGQLWGAQAYNALYASQEASVVGAAAADGCLHTAPLINYYEVIDPDSGEPVPEARGVRSGELCVTALYQGAKPLVRYRTGDLVRLTEALPSASVPSATLEVLGRARDTLELNGNPITGYDLEDLLLSQVRGYLDYQIVIERTGDVDRLTLQLHGTVDEDARHRTIERCREELGTELTISSGELGSITGTAAMVSWKAARVVDRRAPEDHEKRVAHRLAAGRA